MGGTFSRLWNAFKGGAESAAPKAPDPNDSRYWSPGAGVRNVAGVFVDQSVALTYSAVWRAVNLIAGTVATLDVGTFERTAGRKVRVDQPPTDLLGIAASDELDAFSFKRDIMAHALTWGGGFAEIETTKSLKPLALHLLAPDRVTPRRENGAIVYDVRNPSGYTTTLPASRVFHVKGLAFDGLRGYSPIELFRNSIGLGLATERYGAAFFGNGSTPGGVLETDKKIEDQNTIDRLRTRWEELYRGPEKSNTVAVLQDGLKYKPITVPNDVAQFLETRKFQVSDVARIYGIPVHMLGDLDRATFSNIEHQAIEFVTGCIMFWARAIESESDAKLVTDRRRFMTRLDFTSLLRGDAVARSTFYKTMTSIGVFSINDVLSMEDRDPIGAMGEIRLVPMNMVPLDRVQELTDSVIEKNASGAGPEPGDPGDGPDDPTEPDEPGAPSKGGSSEGSGRAVAAVEVVAPTFSAELERANRKAAKAVERYAGRAGATAATFDAELAEFYAVHEQAVAAAFVPHVRTLCRISGIDDESGACDRIRAVIMRELAAQRREFAEAFAADPRAVSFVNDTIAERIGDLVGEMVEAATRAASAAAA